MAVDKGREASIMQIWSDRSEQGYKFRTHGRNDRELIDVEGIALVRRRRKDLPNPDKEKVSQSE